MHQSSAFSIHWIKTFSKRSGTNETLSFFFFWLARVWSAKGRIFTNHCLESIGSTTALLLSLWPTEWIMLSCLTKFPSFLILLIKSSRHAKRSMPWYWPHFSFIVASLLKIIGISRLYFLPMTKSLGSWAGVHFIAPVPNSISTYSSGIIGNSSWLAGFITFIPWYFVYLLSFGLTQTQTSPNIVSGRVVATIK